MSQVLQKWPLLQTLLLELLILCHQEDQVDLEDPSDQVFPPFQVILEVLSSQVSLLHPLVHVFQSFQQVLAFLELQDPRSHLLDPLVLLDQAFQDFPGVQ